MARKFCSIVMVSFWLSLINQGQSNYFRAFRLAGFTPSPAGSRCLARYDHAGTLCGRSFATKKRKRTSNLVHEDP